MSWIWEKVETEVKWLKEDMRQSKNDLSQAEMHNILNSEKLMAYKRGLEVGAMNATAEQETIVRELNEQISNL